MAEEQAAEQRPRVKTVRDYDPADLTGKFFTTNHLSTEPELIARHEWAVGDRNPRFYEVKGRYCREGDPGNLRLSLRYEGEHINFGILWGDTVSDREITPEEIEELKRA